MARRRYKRKRTPGVVIRNASFEKMNAKLGMDQLVHEEAIRRRDAEDRARVATKEARQRQRDREARARRLGRKIQSLEKTLAQAKLAHTLYITTDPEKKETWYEAYEHHMPLREHNAAWRKAQNRLLLTNDELSAIVNHPEMFPNPRLVYCLFTNSHWIMWDGKK
jgi:hypothetical protein